MILNVSGAGISVSPFTTTMKRTGDELPKGLKQSSAEILPITDGTSPSVGDMAEVGRTCVSRPRRRVEGADLSHPHVGIGPQPGILG